MEISRLSGFGGSAHWQRGMTMKNGCVRKAQARILVVAQDRDNLEVLRTMLSSRGYQVTTAEDARDGLERARAGNFHLILTDLSTAGISGWELGRIIKENLPSQPVALVTGWEFGGRPDHSPFDVIISKPFSFEEFRGLVDSLVG
jgi:CheY-like chemotaxis protein